MNIRILCVGRLKERFYEEAVSEFLKRLSRYASVELIEVADEKAPERLSDAQRAQVTLEEGRRLLAKVEKNDFAVALDLKGKELSSPALASSMQAWMNEGKASFVFLAGGSLGLSAEVLSRADYLLSFGKMTFSHQVFRVMLLEQLYRAFKIMHNEPYHK
ncbi:MAG: 23S rRNA (pseudouridine(1915)-N(3))-methyltransferase RlmH [Clostridiaceae bacterium]|nr:23S rRNA (pseudouridine(1915)-N(3))-methyltransferase RlmH [Eubacteriales bacterium]